MDSESGREIRRVFAEEAGVQLVGMARALKDDDLGALRSSAASLRTAAHAQGLRLIVDLLDAMVQASGEGDPDRASLERAVSALHEVLPGILSQDQRVASLLEDISPEYVEPAPTPLLESAIPSSLRYDAVQERSVLIADDSPTTRRMHADILSNAGFTVRTARDGTAALRQIETEIPDLVVTDYDMAPMNGPALIRALRDDERLAQVPVVLVSARTPQELHELTDGLGIEQIVSKTESAPEAIAEAATAVVAQAAGSARGVRILVAEDSEILRRVVCDQIRAAGYEAIEARDGEEAIRLAREERPDVALLDREMPNRDGMEALAVLKGQPETAAIPVVFVTGRVTPEELAEGLDQGAHDYVRKPVEPAELLARIRSALRLRRLHSELAARNEELEALSRTDVLTGLTNRRHATLVLNAAIGAASRHTRPLSVVMMDVDHFKSVNDTHGHAIGDEALRRVAEVLTRTLRLEDTAARWGGEEFLVVLPDIGLDGAEQVAERLRAGLESEPVACDGATLTVTASFGVAEWGPQELTEKLVARADQALYEAKESGRNRVCAASPVVVS